MLNSSEARLFRKSRASFPPWTRAWGTWRRRGSWGVGNERSLSKHVVFRYTECRGWVPVSTILALAEEN